MNCAYSTCYHLDFFAQLPSPVVTESREAKKIGNLLVYSGVMTFWMCFVKSWIVPILHVIIWIFLHSCILLLLLSPGNLRKLETYGYISELWHFECFLLKIELCLFYMLSSGFFCTAAFSCCYWVQGTKENWKLMGIFRSYDILNVFR